MSPEPEDLIRKYEEMIKLESYHCQRVAYEHQNSKQQITSYKLSLKVAKEKLREKLRNVEK